MVTFLHTADWQIGMTRRWLQPEAQARFDSDRLDAVRRAGEIARAQGCAFVVVAGDVFESNQLRQGTVLRALEVMREMELPVYLLPGNHDPLDSISIYRQPTFLDACPSNVTVLDSTQLVDVVPGVQVIGAPWAGKHPGRDLVGDALAGLPAPDGTIRIVVGHGIVDVLDPSGANPAAIDSTSLLEALADRQIHYVALGDRHSRTDVGGHGTIWYSGAVEVTDPREEVPGDVLVVTVEPDLPPVVAYHHTGRWDFVTLRRDVLTATDVDALVNDLAAMPHKDKVVLKLALQGTLDLADYTRLHERLESLRPIFGGMHEWERHTDVSVRPGDAQWSALGLSGYVCDAADDIKSQLADLQDGVRFERDDGLANGDEAPTASGIWRFDPQRGDDRDSARDALALLYRLTSAAQR